MATRRSTARKRDGGSLKYIYRLSDKTQFTAFTGIIDL